MESRCIGSSGQALVTSKNGVAAEFLPTDND